MKRLSIIFLILIGIFLVGCSGNPKKQGDAKANEKNDEAPQITVTETNNNKQKNRLSDDKIVCISALSPQEGMNIYKKISFDRETYMGKMGFSDITLYTDAELDENGDIMWDDGQNFELMVHSDKGGFPLIQKTYIQFGTIEFASFMKMESEEFCIMVTIPAGASYSVYEYTYDFKKNQFTGNDIYLAENINWLESR